MVCYTCRMTTSVEIWAPAFTEFAPQKGVGFAPDKRGTKYEQLKNVDPETADFSVKTKFLPRHLTVDFIFSQYLDKTWCKLCEDEVLGNREKHHAKHMRELQNFLQAKREVVTDRFFPNPCTQCGEEIPWKPGRAPKLCNSCKSPVN